MRSGRPRGCCSFARNALLSDFIASIAAALSHKLSRCCRGALATEVVEAQRCLTGVGIRLPLCLGIAGYSRYRCWREPPPEKGVGLFCVMAHCRGRLTSAVLRPQIDERNGHRCPVCAPRKRVLDPGSTFPPVARMAVSVARMAVSLSPLSPVGEFLASSLRSASAGDSRPTFLLSVDLLSRRAARLAPSDHLSLIKFLTSCDVPSNRSAQGEGDYAS
jgi:hypothetical protein